MGGDKSASSVLEEERFNNYLKENKLLEIVQKITTFAEKRGKEDRIFIVGGFIRDYFLQKANLDVDFILENNAIQFAEELTSEYNLQHLRVHRNFCTANVLMKLDAADDNGEQTHHHQKNNEIKIDFCTARKETYPKPAILPSVVFNQTIESDLYRRDFTINAMAIQISPASDYGKLIDFYNGKEDLKNKVIRVIHNQSYIDDPTRIFRAFRFASRFGYQLENIDLINQSIETGVFNLLTGTRIMHEIQLIFHETNHFLQSFEYMKRFGILKELFLISDEEIERLKLDLRLARVHDLINKYNLNHHNHNNLKLVHIENWKIFLFVMIDHLSNECSKPILTRLLIPDNLQNLIYLTKDKMNSFISSLNDGGENQPKNSDIYHQFINCSVEGLICMLSSDQFYDKFISKQIFQFLFFYKYEKLSFDGKEVMRHFGIKPGSLIRDIKDRLFNALLDGEVTHDKNDQFAFIEREFFSKN